MTEIRSRDLIAALDEASLSRFHLRAVVVSGMGFFTDAYDLFVIGIASALITTQWDLSSGRLALLNSSMLGAAFLGAFVFGRLADLVDRKRRALAATPPRAHGDPPRSGNTYHCFRLLRARGWRAMEGICGPKEQHLRTF